MRFVDEGRDDEWMQTSLTLQGDLGWGQFTSATSYFTRDIEYFQDNTDYTFYLSNALRRLLRRHYDLGPDPRRPRLERQSVRASVRAGVSPAGRDGAD